VSKAGAGRLENRGDVSQDLFRLRFDVRRQASGARLAPACPETKTRLPTIIPGEYGPTGLGRLPLVTACSLSGIP
jgi:hypothetical protein